MRDIEVDEEWLLTMEQTDEANPRDDEAEDLGELLAELWSGLEYRPPATMARTACPAYRGEVTWKYDGPDHGPSFPYANQIGAPVALLREGRSNAVGSVPAMRSPGVGRQPAANALNAGTPPSLSLGARALPPARVGGLTGQRHDHSEGAGTRQLRLGEWHPARISGLRAIRHDEQRRPSEPHSPILTRRAR